MSCFLHGLGCGRPAACPVEERIALGFGELFDVSCFLDGLGCGRPAARPLEDRSTLGFEELFAVSCFLDGLGCGRPAARPLRGTPLVPGNGDPSADLRGGEGEGLSYIL